MAAAVLAAPSFSATSPDVRARHILERNWCDLARYDQARRIDGLSKFARRNLSSAKALVRKRPQGCRWAEAVAGRHKESIPTRAAWLRKGRGGNCPRSPLAVSPADKLTAARMAAEGLPRQWRSVAVEINNPDRTGAVTHACGATARSRSVVVTFTFSAFLPSASISLHVVAVSHFSRYGWRVWKLLH